ncbi:hypothetical protein BGZ83_006471 [Gryganskiella cystojenkinii]|nr:hypothetical protein BGZ83_006471 [Gryganskiella cystojenkinii]
MVQVLSPSDSSHPLLSSHPGDLSSATRSAIRGFILAFIAGSILDVLFPAVLKQKFKGLGHRLFFGNQSSVALGASAGGFAFCYKILFRHITLFFDRVTKSFPYEQLKSSMRIDSGVDLDLDGEQVQGQEENANGIIESKLSSRKWVPAALAALLASPAFALIPGQARRLTMAMYFLTYAGEVTYSALEFKGLTQWLPSWFGIWLLFPISAGQTIHTFFHHGDCFPLAFRKVIMSQSNPYLVRPRGYDAKTLGPYPEGEHVFIALSNYARARAYNAHLPASAIQPELSDTATAVSSLATVAATAGSFLVPSSTESVLRHTEGMGHHSALCRFFHPNTPSCSAAAMTLAGRYMKFALKLYGTLAVLAFLAKGGNVVKHGYLNYFKRSGIATVKSAVSTWGMMVTSFSLLCTMDRYLPATFMPTKRLYLNGFLGGLWILVESPQRQSALTLYYTRFMLEGLWRRLVKAGWATNFKNGETLIFGLAMAVIMGIFESLPKMQRKSMIQGALTKIFVD